MVETKSGAELAAGGAATAVTVGVVMAATSDGTPVVDGLVSGVVALVGFAFWVWLLSTAMSAS